MNDGRMRGRRAVSAAVLVGLMVVTTAAVGDPQPRSHPDRTAFDPIVHHLPGDDAVPTTLNMRSQEAARVALDDTDSPPDDSVSGRTGGQAGRDASDRRPGGPSGADNEPAESAPDPIDALPDRYGGEQRSTRLAVSRAERNRRQERTIFGQKPLSDRVIFRVNLGYGLDGGTPRGENPFLAPLRTYYYGDLVIGSRGLVSPSLSTYLASQFRFDQAASGAPPIPSLFYSKVPSPYGPGDPRDIWVRSAYGTWQGVSKIRVLRPLYIRMGRQFRYGPAIAHFDGITIGYDTPAISVATFAGDVVDVTGIDIGAARGTDSAVAGLDARIDLYRIANVPLVLSGEVLSFADSTHMRGSLALRINRDIALGATVRTRGQKIARTGVRLRARVRRVTLIDVQVENRSGDDWMYDVFASDASPGADRPDNPLYYFRMGPVVPRLYIEARAGTVLLRNIDVLVHGRGAIRQGSDDQRSPHAASFGQGGAAIEVHVRRSINLGLGFLARRYYRPEPTTDVFSSFEGADVTSDSVGEKSFAEGNATVRYSQGARKFSASAELYLRWYDFQSSYAFADLLTDPAAARLDRDLRGGGRFSVEGWAGENLRLRAEYDVTTALVVAPELSGIKSLRILAEGRF